MYANNKEEHDYNLAAKASYDNEIQLMQKAQEYGEFFVLCDRSKLDLISFEDFIKI